MNAMRYDAAAIGNHEFNYGVPFLDRAVGQARFPFLSANTYAVDGKRKYRAWTMVERGGARIALVGATTPGVEGLGPRQPSRSRHPAGDHSRRARRGARGS